MTQDSRDGETVGVLMPSITNFEKFHTRYAGLENELHVLGKTAVFAFSHDSYDSETHSLIGLIDTRRKPIHLGVQPRVVRDLTMPKEDKKPIYIDPKGPRLIHSSDFNALLRDKSRVYKLLPELHPQTFVALREEVTEAATSICGKTVVVKPVVGERSQGVFIGKKAGIPKSLDAERYLVQEYVDTSRGLPELGITGVHNVRLMSIDSKVVGAVGRVNESDNRHLKGLQDDSYGSVYLPEDLPASMLQIADKVISRLKTLPDGSHHVIAIDLMRGINSAGDEIDILCEVNRRPLRISMVDLKEPQLDPKGIIWLAKQWDEHEAKMLSKLSEEVQ